VLLPALGAGMLRLGLVAREWNALTQHHAQHLCVTHHAPNNTRTLERYPGNGKVMKVYARFLEFVRNEPGAAARFYDAAVKAGTSESLVSLTAGEEGATQLTCVAGTIDEKVDGLVIINAQVRVAHALVSAPLHSSSCGAPFPHPHTPITTTTNAGRAPS
jgi:hypothetical protein